MCFSPARDECGQVQGQSWILAMVVIQVGANDYPELPRLASAYFHLHARSRLRIFAVQLRQAVDTAHAG